jgi:hypothetical protein
MPDGFFGRHNQNFPPKVFSPEDAALHAAIKSGEPIYAMVDFD